MNERISQFIDHLINKSDQNLSVKFGKIDNFTIIIFTFILDSNFFMKEEFSKPILYERIELIKPENREALMVDLRERTGLNIHRIKIEKINFLQDSANITVFYSKKKAG